MPQLIVPSIPLDLLKHIGCLLLPVHDILLGPISRFLSFKNIDRQRFGVNKISLFLQSIDNSLETTLEVPP